MSGNKIDGAIGEFRSLDTSANQDQWMNRLHPLVKLFLTILYITVTVSFSRYQLAALKRLIKEVDPQAFFTIHVTTGVYGYGRSFHAVSEIQD